LGGQTPFSNRAWSFSVRPMNPRTSACCIRGCHATWLCVWKSSTGQKKGDPMGPIRLHSLCLGWCCFLGMASFVVPSAAQSGKGKPKAFPKGSEKAVAGVRAALPKAVTDEVAEPKGFGGSGGKGKPLFWSVRLHAGGKKLDLSVTPEGVIIRLPTPVEVKDL